ncbi:hypothetical protein RYZ26_04230 [Terasakiella sp. A23]|uniref:hypothetical protein n=1 Tax=Terasakiella sp. FCG-A23 TaxID=3080561 RepID=UPI002952E6EF|nr:hypothetical protein [Terasakiella sp. A23]MDV7338789.1 hypothetical protein [Terasakiella sp. A23]
MSSVTKPIAASTSPVTTSRAGNAARQVSSQYGAVSELFAQTGVRGEDENRGFEGYDQGQGHRNPSHEQPQTLKLHGTSRTFAMLFEEAQDEYKSVNDDGGYYDSDGVNGGGKPAFQAYMAKATSTYDLSTRAINGETKNRGGSLNVAL